MSNRSHRILCRAGFLTFCLLPTLAVGGWIVQERVIQGALSPAETVRAKPLAEEELSRLLGLSVSLNGLSYPHSGITVLEGLTLTDPETGQQIAFIPALEMAYTATGFELIATRPEIDADRWSSLWHTLHDRVLRQRGGKTVDTRLSAQQVVFTSQRPGKSPTLTDVMVRFSSGQVDMDFRLAGVNMPNPAQFKATRDRTGQVPATRWELHTGDAPLPCVLFSDFAPWLDHVGEACQYNGSLWAEESLDGWRGELTGRFSRLDLDRLITEQFPHKLSGEADVTVSRAEFTQGRVYQASGWIEAGPGTVSRSLLAAAVETFDLRITDRLVEVAAPLSRYGQIALGFELDADGLRLSGNCDPEGAMLVLENDADARVLDHHTRITPVVSLVRMLAPISEVQVSATQETDALLRVLPLPPIKRPQPPAAATPESRVRLSGDSR